MLAIIGVPLALTGVAMYFLPGSAFPVLVIGLSLVTTGPRHGCCSRMPMTALPLPAPGSDKILTTMT